MSTCPINHDKLIQDMKNQGVVEMHCPKCDKLLINLKVIVK